LLRRTGLYDAPFGRRLTTLPTRTPFRSRAVLAVGARRGSWIGVYTEHRPNGHLGWIRARDARLLRETWTIEVDLSARRAVVRHQGKRYARFPVAVGGPATPTPAGRFGVTDRLRTGGPGSPYGCCVLALSGRQRDVPQDWPGGDRIAIHGTNAPASVGQAVSHGCLRASAEDLRLLMARIPLGSLVTVRA
jgi:hypothetical protein